MARHILVINSGCRVRRRPCSWNGGVYLDFMEITRVEDLDQLQGQVYDDVVWVRPLTWDHKDRDYIESAVRTRMVIRET